MSAQDRNVGRVGASQLNGEAAITITNDGSKIGLFDAAMLRVAWKGGERNLSFDVPLGRGRTIPIPPRRPTTIELGIGLSDRLNDPTTSDRPAPARNKPF